MRNQLTVAVLLFLTLGSGVSEPVEEIESQSNLELAMATRDWWAGHIARLENPEPVNPIVRILQEEVVVSARRRAGDFAMFNPNLPPAEKYPYAYKHYQELLAIRSYDPDSQEKLEMIEGIYRSLGRPIPQL